MPKLESWLLEAGIGYCWEPGLGGFRKPVPCSPNVALCHLSFRAYADCMAADAFHQALERVLSEAARQVTVVMCAETLQRGGEQQQHDRAVQGEQPVDCWPAPRWLSGPISCARMMLAISPAIMKNANETIMYRWPITLWSVEDSQSTSTDRLP